MTTRSKKPKRHLVAAVDDIELYRVDDDFGCQWIRRHQGVETCMGERAARSLFTHAKKRGEIFDLDLENEMHIESRPSEDSFESSSG